MADSSLAAMCNVSEHSINPKSLPLSESQLLEQGSPSEMDREYEFFVTTQEPHQPEGVERGLIRRLVMRNFFEAKWAGLHKNASEHNSASTVMAGKQLKSRFRLSKIVDGSREAKVKRREFKIQEKPERQKRPRALRTDSSMTEASLVAEEQKSKRDSRKNSLVEYKDTRRRRNNKSNEIGRDKRLLLRVCPSAHRFDPFDVLPVPGTPQLDTLFKLCKSTCEPARSSEIFVGAHGANYTLNRQKWLQDELNSHQRQKYLVVFHFGGCGLTSRHISDMGIVWNACERPG